MADAATVETLISPEMAAAVGREYEWATSYPIDPSDIRRWAVAMYYPAQPPPLYWDEAHARSTRWGGIVAPEEFNPFAWMRAEPKGDMGVEAARPWPELKLGIPCPEFKANIFAGQVVEYTKVRMRPGDVIKSAVRLGGYHEKRGRLGLMLFTVREELWTNQNAELVRTSRSELIRYL
jgi:hypothetical protein